LRLLITSAVVTTAATNTTATTSGSQLRPGATSGVLNLGSNVAPSFTADSTPAGIAPGGSGHAQNAATICGTFFVVLR
jgi:hypothetical protein